MAQSIKKYDKARNAMLAKVHIAVNQLGIEDEDYRDIIEAQFPGKRSAGKLSNRQLNNLLRYFESKGFKSYHKSANNSQIDALQEKAEKMLNEASELGLVRHPRKLVLKICTVSDIKFCSDVGKLKRLLAVLQRVQ